MFFGWRFTGLTRTSLLVLGIFVGALRADDAVAYVDPNAAGLLYQILFPVIVALAAGWRWVRQVVTLGWHWLTSRFR